MKNDHKPNWFDRLVDLIQHNLLATFLLINVAYAFGYFVYAFLTWIFN
jgi:hypothetical protein